MQANGLQRRQEHALQLGSSCGFPAGTTFTVWPQTIERGFRPATGTIQLFNTKIRFPTGVEFSCDVGGAVALAESEGYRINFEPYYLQLNAGEEAVRTAYDIGLPQGFAVRRDTNDDGIIERVYIWTPNGDFYTSYHHLASLGIDTTTIRCRYWLEKRQYAVDNHFPDEGWAASRHRTGNRITCMYAPNGDMYNNIAHAWIAAGVIRPPEDLLGVVSGFIDIVRNLNGSITLQKVADLAGVRKTAFSRFLNSSVSSSPPNIYKINSLFGVHNLTNTNILREAAIEAGVDDIAAYNRRMTVIMDSLTSRVVEPPEPYRRAEEPTNEFAGLVNAGHVAVGVVDDQDPPQIQADNPPLPIPQVPVDADEGLVNFAEV